ncbi:MAG TPA: hypothetical protein VFK10_11845, partial [Burkholderiaceae bacterium]|nr:hypothetical protein [Burkholderiaceae bacterium]
TAGTVSMAMAKPAPPIGEAVEPQTVHGQIFETINKIVTGASAPRMRLIDAMMRQQGRLS